MGREYEEVDALKEVLTRELTIHEELIETANRLNAALRENRLEEVRDISARYDSCTCRIEHLEQERLAVCDRLAARLGLPDRHVNIRRLLDSLPGEEREGLAKVRDRLKQKLGSLARVNTSNRILMEESLQEISRTVEFMSRAGGKPAGYRRGGKLDTSVMRRSMINRTA